MASKYFLSMEHAAICVGLSIRQFRSTYYEGEGKTTGRITQIGRAFFVTIPDLEKWAKENGRTVSLLAVSSTVSR